MDRLIDGRYRVTQELASGGMGVVLLAEDEQAGTEVAIKVVRGDLANSAEAVARFRREMKVLATLDSPRIVTAYEAGSVSGMPFLVMERLRGQGLDDLLDECGPLPLARAIDIAIELLEALADAHAAGVVHRDLKPSNIWLTPGGDLKLLDFGVAKMRTEAPADGYETTGILTGTGAVLGSPAYMAPEQLVSSKEADERADLWSVGVILYELVTGRLLFEAKTVGGVFANVLQMPIPPLRHVHPGASGALERVVGRCLHRDPEQRLASAAVMAESLRAIQDAGVRGTVLLVDDTASHDGGAAGPDVDSVESPRTAAGAPGVETLTSHATLVPTGATRRGLRSGTGGITVALVLTAAAALIVVAALLGTQPVADRAQRGVTPRLTAAGYEVADAPTTPALPPEPEVAPGRDGPSAVRTSRAPPPTRRLPQSPPAKPATLPPPPAAAPSASSPPKDELWPESRH